MSPGLPALLLLATTGAVPEAAPGDLLRGAAPSLLIAAVLLCCSAFFSGSETALFSLQPYDRQGLPQPGRGRVEGLLRHPRRTLATILIGNELVNVTLSTVTAGLLLVVAPDLPWINIVVLTPLLLVFGEVLPKVMSLRYNRRIASAVSLPLGTFSVVVAPLRWVLTRVADAFLVATGGTTAPRQAEVREAQLRALVDRGREAGSIKPMEQEMLHKVFEFGDHTVARLMTPRPDVFSVSLTTPWEELLETVRSAGFSRVPVWQGRPDNIVGVLVVKRLLPVLQRMREDRAFTLTPRDLKRRLIPPRFVPTTKRAQDMLREFRTERYHMAIVVDEHGSVVGVVTLDDLLAELVGELLDETDVDEVEVIEVGRNMFTVRGSMDIDDFAARFDLEMPEGDYTTVGGFVLATAGDVPEKGEEVEWEGLRFIVSGVDGRRITEVCVCPAEDESGEANPAPEEVARG